MNRLNRNLAVLLSFCASSCASLIGVSEDNVIKLARDVYEQSSHFVTYGYTVANEIMFNFMNDYDSALVVTGKGVYNFRDFLTPEQFLRLADTNCGKTRPNGFISEDGFSLAFEVLKSRMPIDVKGKLYTPPKKL